MLVLYSQFSKRPNPSGHSCNKMKIFKLKIKNRLTAEVHYENSVKAEGEQPFTNQVVVNSGRQVHPDLLEALDALTPHIENICEWTDGGDYTTTGFVIGGDGAGVTLIGQKETRTGKVVNITTPFTKFDPDAEQYSDCNELSEAVWNVVREAQLYLEGKSAQFSLFDGQAQAQEVELKMLNPKRAKLLAEAAQKRLTEGQRKLTAHVEDVEPEEVEVVDRAVDEFRAAVVADDMLSQEAAKIMAEKHYSGDLLLPKKRFKGGVVKIDGHDCVLSGTASRGDAGYHTLKFLFVWPVTTPASQLPRQVIAVKCGKKEYYIDARRGHDLVVLVEEQREETPVA